MHRILQLIVLISPCVFVAQNVENVRSQFDNVEPLDRYIALVEELKNVSRHHRYHEEDFLDTLYENITDDAEEYDFVVVGAGAGGSVVASRLSEVGEWRVLLLEAGGAENLATETPRLAPLLHTSPFSWAFATTPQKTWCLGMEENKCYVPMGKALGGSTAINAMLFTRGSRYDYEEWTNLGLPGWGYDDVLPYFKKMENSSSLRYRDDEYRSAGGPLNVENPQYSPRYLDNILRAGEELGYQIVDYNGRDQIGVAIPQVTTKSGRRCSATAYLRAARERHNLSFKTAAQVVKIDLDAESKEARSVLYLQEGRVHRAMARKEIILSAGPINTPKLLMLSGIGPKDDLEVLGIELMQDLQVGRQLKEHVGFFGLNFVFNESEPVEANDIDEYKAYFEEGKGPLTSPGIVAFNYVKTKGSFSTDSSYPDVELYFADTIHNEGLANLRNIRIRRETYDSIWRPLEGRKGFSVTVMQTHPRSSGTLRLRDKDPLHFPLIDSNQLSDPEGLDMETMLSGVKQALALEHTAALQELGVRLNSNPVAGCERDEFSSDDYWRCAIRHLSISLSHVSGTAKMGTPSDKMAVVDGNLKVYGVNKLRVADSSVIPVSISGHLMAASLMVGEKASDLIKDEWVDR